QFLRLLGVAGGLEFDRDLLLDRPDLGQRVDELVELRLAHFGRLALLLRWLLLLLLRRPFITFLLRERRGGGQCGGHAKRGGDAGGANDSLVHVSSLR